MTRAVQDAIWEAIVDRAELLHGKAVNGQTRPSWCRATKVVALADQISTLARATALLAAKRHT